MAEKRFQVNIKKQDGALDLDALVAFLTTLGETVDRLDGRLRIAEPATTRTTPQMSLISLGPFFYIAHKRLTAAYSVVAPDVPDNAIVIFFFDHGTGFGVTWTDPAFPNKPVMGSTAGKFSAVLMRKQPGPRFNQIAGEVVNQDLL